MKIETERLVLRKWLDSDFQRFCEINQDDKVVEFLPGKLTKNETQDFIANANEHIEKYGYGLWATVLRQTQELIGFVGLKYRDYENFKVNFAPCVEVGWRLSSQHWKKGYATEAAKMVLQVGFSQFDLKEIISFTVPQNLRSIAVMERIGMKRDVDFLHPNLPFDHRLSKHVLYRLP